MKAYLYLNSFGRESPNINVQISKNRIEHYLNLFMNLHLFWTIINFLVALHSAAD